MISVRTTDGSRAFAVLIRVVAFLVAAVSVVVIPSTLAAAAAGHIATDTAFTATGAAAGLSLATSLLARGLDPLRPR